MTTILNKAGGAKQVLKALWCIKGNKSEIVRLAVGGFSEPSINFRSRAVKVELASGICDMVGDLLDITEIAVRHHLFDSFYESWDNFSGNFPYPVKEDSENPGELFGMADPDEMWDPYFEYAQMRWELLDHLISCLEREVDNEAHSQGY